MSPIPARSAPTHDLLSSWDSLLRAPGAPALCFGTETITRHGIELLAQRHLAALRALAPAKGQLLGLSLPNSPDWLAWLLASWRCGLAVVPFESASPAPAADLGLAFLVDSHGPRRLPGTTRRRAVLLKLTSGSTGRPKALPFSAAALAADGRNIIAGMKIGPDDSALACLPFSHSYGFGNFVLPLLLQGTPIVLAPSALPSALLETARLHRPRVLPLVPPLVRLLATAPGDPADFASLKLVLCAGGRLLPAEAEAFRQRWGHPVANFYGSSETGGICFSPDAAKLPENSVGPPLPGVTLHCDTASQRSLGVPPGASQSDTGFQPVPVLFGSNSSLITHHSSLASASPHRIRVTSQAVTGRKGHITLPDLGRLEPDGSLTLLGRAGRTFKIGGRRLEPAEIEATLLQVPGVREARVLPVSGRRGEAEIGALVESDLVANALREALRDRLPAWKTPSVWHVSPALPRTARGKVDWAKCQF